MANFTTLWNNHPTVKGEKPLLDTVSYENQCAVNLAAAMMRSGYDFKTYRGVKSWQKEGTKYPIRAEQLASWLTTAAAKLPNKVVQYNGKEIKDEKTGQDVFDTLNNKTGIIFFRDYWGPGMQGDHIDLWNGARMTARSSWFRAQLGITYEGMWSDFLKAKAVWFWLIP
jgi:hypothetical protein